MKLKLKAKITQWNVTKVLSATDKGIARALIKFGGFVRQTARRSMTKRKKPAPPGRPPGVKLGTMKRLLFFAYEPREQVVVIGPEKFATKGKDAMQALELGGTSIGIIDGKRKRLRIEARPFMRPALLKELPTLPKQFQNIVKG
jgi:hypothetical protein